MRIASGLAKADRARGSTRQQSHAISASRSPRFAKETYVPHIMLRHPISPTMLGPTHQRAPALPSLVARYGSGVRAVNVRRVEHRDGAGHLDPTYAAELRARVRERARSTGERAFVSGSSRTDAGAEEAGKEFVMSVTSGVDGGELRASPVETSEERGGPFIETSANVEFAYDTDDSNQPAQLASPSRPASDLRGNEGSRTVPVPHEKLGDGPLIAAMDHEVRAWRAIGLLRGLACVVLLFGPRADVDVGRFAVVDRLSSPACECDP